jgi:hypothetical protein
VVSGLGLVRLYGNDSPAVFVLGLEWTEPAGSLKSFLD